MQSAATTPDEYLADLEPDWRRSTLEQLRTIIQEKGPELDEAIRYKMLGYSVDDDTVFHLNAQKNYVSLYVGDASKVDPEGDMLDGLDVGKGCIRFKKSNAVDETRIGDFIAQTMTLWRNGEDVSC